MRSWVSLMRRASSMRASASTWARRSASSMRNFLRARVALSPRALVEPCLPRRDLCFFLFACAALHPRWRVGPPLLGRGPPLLTSASRSSCKSFSWLSEKEAKFSRRSDIQKISYTGPDNSPVLSIIVQMRRAKRACRQWVSRRPRVCAGRSFLFGCGLRQRWPCRRQRLRCAIGCARL